MCGWVQRIFCGWKAAALSSQILFQSYFPLAVIPLGLSLFDSSAVRLDLKVSIVSLQKQVVQRLDDETVNDETSSRCSI